MDTLNLYQQTNDPSLGQKLLDEHKVTIDKHIQKWQGVLPDIVIQKHAHKYALEAFKSFDASKGANINTHLFNHLSKLSRLNYEHQNVVKIPEHQILQIRNYQDTVAHLTDRFDREPTHEEIADHMVIPVAHVKRLAQNIGRKDYTYDSDDPEIQQATEVENPEALYIKDNFTRLGKNEQQQFRELTGYQDSDILKPSAFGKKYNLKPYEVSRLKSSLAKKFGR